MKTNLKLDAKRNAQKALKALKAARAGGFLDLAPAYARGPMTKAEDLALARATVDELVKALRAHKARLGK